MVKWSSPDVVNHMDKAGDLKHLVRRWEPQFKIHTKIHTSFKLLFSNSLQISSPSESNSLRS